MAEKIFMIALSPTMEEGTILKWMKLEGDEIDTGDIICEVETDKASMEYESAQEGTLLKVLKNEGTSARVGETIAILGAKGEDISSVLEEGEQQSTAGAPAAVPTPEKAQVQPVTAAGSSYSIEGTASGGRSAAEAAEGTASGGRVVSSPLARKLAEQRGIDIAAVSGTGPRGRIVKRDIENHTSTPSSAMTMRSEDITIPVSGKRAVIARRLSESKFTAPHYYVKNTVAMDNLISARTMLNKETPEKVSFNAFILKFAAEAIKRYPEINSSWQGDSILQFGSIDIGLAVDLGSGLITPIVRNVGNKGIEHIDEELKHLIQKVRENSLKPEEYSGATFTISNLGSFGVDEFTAIINPPGSAILALGRVNTVPVYDENLNLKPCRQMRITLSCDHRVIDGALAGRFISELQRMIEAPVRVLF